jgi:ketosteroid isomerase-like protein
MSEERDMRSVVLRYFECLDQEDWGSMRDLWRADGELRAVGARPRDGVDAVIGYFSKLFAPWPTHEDRPTRLLVAPADRVVTAEVVFTGRTHEGRDVRFEAVDVFDLTDGRIQRLSNWYDIDFVRRTLTATATEDRR